MYSKQTTVKNATGLHARPATEFVNLAKKYKSDITVDNLAEPGEAAANAKSIIRVLACGIACGTLVEIAADGEDEREAVNALVELVDSGFGEE